MAIHPTSIISKEAEIASDVEIGPFCVVSGRVRIDSGTRLFSHVCVGSEYGVVEIGKGNKFFAGSVIGGPPQDLKYKAEPTKLIIGDNNVIRECATLNIGTEGGGGVTSLGNNNLLMAYVHIAHDCHLGNNITIANSSNLAGHVEIEDFVRIGGVCCFNQFTRLGRYSYIAGDSTVNKDVLPYSIAQGKYAVVRATNKIGLERAGFSPENIESLHRAIRIIIKGSGTVEEGLRMIEEKCTASPELEHFVNFIRKSQRGLAK